MKRGRKIAVGVALGIAVVAVGVAKGPVWVHTMQVWHYERILNHLTPEEAITLCGQPIRDESESSGGTVRRGIVVRNYYALAVELDFAAAANELTRWQLTAIKDPSGSPIYQTTESKFLVLPCLDKKVKKVTE
jgi:hypothetical protein